MTARARLVGGVLALATMLVGCEGATPTGDRAGMDARIGDRSQPRVVATTAVLGDVVSAIGGEAIALTVLIPPGVDPHAFEPAPADAMALEDADLIFVNGFDLEESLLPLLDERVAAGARVVSASAGIAARVPGDGELRRGGGERGS